MSGNKKYHIFTVQTLYMTDFLEQIKLKCQQKAKQMNQLELSVWDEKHEAELNTHFCFTDKKLKERKKQLENDL